MRRLLALLVVLTVAPAALPVAVHAEANAARAAAADPALDAARADAERAREAARAAETKVMIYEQKNLLTTEGQANLQIVIGEFGVAITVAVLLFGAASVVSAGRAARAEIREARDEVEKLKRDAAEARSEAQNASRDAAAANAAALTASADAQTAANAARAMQRQIADDAATIATTKAQAEANAALIREVAQSSAASRPQEAANLRPAEVQRVAEAASAVAAQPETRRTADDYRVLILDALTRRDWPAAIDLAEAMRAATADAETDNLYACQVAAYARAMNQDHGGAIALFDHLIDRLRTRTTMPEIAWLAMAMRDKGVALNDGGRPLDAIAAYQAVIDRFGDSDVPEIVEQVATAMRDKGVAFGRLDRWDDAAAAHQAMIDRFGDSADPEVQTEVAKAMINKGFALGKGGHRDDELAAYDAAIARFGASDDPPIEEQVVMAMINKGITLDGPDTGPAATTFADVIAKYADNPAPPVVDGVSRARFYLACFAARTGDVATTIARLREWHAKADQPCARIAADRDFDPVRADPAFAAYLAEIGCPPAVPAAAAT